MGASPSETDKAYTLLPAKIERIEVQKKNAGRYSLFVGDQFLIGVSESVLIHCKLKKGLMVTHQLFDEIQKLEYRQQIRSYLIDLLSRRDHSSRELHLKGLKKGYPADILDELITELQQKGFINNREFAEKFARDKAAYKNWGSLKIKSELLSKGISASDTEAAIQIVFEDVDAREAILELARKKLPAFRRTAPDKRREKIYRYLSGRGYTGEEIMKNLPDILFMIESS